MGKPLCRQYIYNNVQGLEADIVEQLLILAECSPDGEMLIRLGKGRTAAATPKTMAQACGVDIICLIGTLQHLERLGFLVHQMTWHEDQEGPGSISISKWYIKQFK